MDIILEYFKKTIKQIEKIKKDDKYRYEQINIVFAICDRFINEKNNQYTFEHYMYFFDKIKDDVINMAANNHSIMSYIATIENFIEILNCIDCENYQKDDIASFIADIVEIITQEMDTKNHNFLYSSFYQIYEKNNNLDIFYQMILKLYTKVIRNDKLNLEPFDIHLNLWKAVSILKPEHHLVGGLFFLKNNKLSDCELHKFYRLFNVNGGFYKLKDDIIDKIGFTCSDGKDRLFASLMILWKYNNTNVMQQTYKEKDISKEDRDSICGFYIWIKDFCDKKLHNDDTYISWMAKIITNSQSDDKILYVKQFIKDFLNDKDGIITNEITNLNNLAHID